MQVILGSELYVTVNLEEGMPHKEQAIKKLTFFVMSKKELGYRAMKVIHGFGSSGKGGVLRTASREYLSSLKRRKVIADFIPGEDFSIFNEATRKATQVCPDLSKDRDLERHNNGVTIVIF